MTTPNALPPGAATTPLNLYDYTHGQRRLTVWGFPDRQGRPVICAYVAVPVTMQAPGEPPETTWVTVARVLADHASLVRAPAGALDDYHLVCDGTCFMLYRMEAQAIADYLGLDAGPLDDGEGVA